MRRVALVTGFEPYGGRSGNPSAVVANTLDGTTIAGLAIAGRVLPVALDGLGRRVDLLLAEHDPALVIATGLAPGEAVIRLERIGVNLADFAIPDNRGRRVVDRPLARAGPDALFATLPLRAILRALGTRGIPARMSESAGLYLCNAMLYRLLLAIRRRVPCGLIHLPCLPEQAVRRPRLGDDPPLPSMAAETMVEAVRVAIGVTARLSAGTRR